MATFRTMLRSLPLSLLVLASTATVPVAFAAGVPLTSCSDIVTGAAFLTGDLDCSAAPDPITITRGRLDLGGFTLTGSFGRGIACVGSCRVSNGTVIGSITGSKSVQVRNVDMSGGISADKNVHVRDSAILYSSAAGISAYYGTVKLEDSTITNTRLDGVHVEQNNARILRSTITDSGHSGVRGRKVQLKDSTVTGSGLAPECNAGGRRVCNGGVDAGGACDTSADCSGATCVFSVTCADLHSFRLPVLRNSTCETSANANGGQTWHACSAD